MEEYPKEKLQVFVVDSSTYIHKAFKLCLPPPNFEIKCFTDSHEAVEQILAQGPALIFVDVDSKPLNGYAISQKIKDLDTDAQNIPIVLTSSTLTPFDSDRFEVSRANAKLYKPFDNSQLSKVMSQIKPIKEFLNAIRQEPNESQPEAVQKNERKVSSAKFKELFDPQKSHIKSLDQLIDNRGQQIVSAPQAQISEERDSLSNQLMQLTFKDATSKKGELGKNSIKTEFEYGVLENNSAADGSTYAGQQTAENPNNKVEFNLQDQILISIQNEVTKYLSDPAMTQMISEQIRILLPQLAEKIVRAEIKKLMGTQETEERPLESDREDVPPDESSKQFEPIRPSPPMMISRTDY